MEPCHEIMVLFILRKLTLQTRMRSHPVGLNVWFLVGLFVYFHTSCVRTAKALAWLCGQAGSPEPPLVAYVVSPIISWAGSIDTFQMTPFWRQSSMKSLREKPNHVEDFLNHDICMVANIHRAIQKLAYLDIRVHCKTCTPLSAQDRSILRGATQSRTWTDQRCPRHMWHYTETIPTTETTRRQLGMGTVI